MAYDQAFLDKLPLTQLEQARCSENPLDCDSEISDISSHGDCSDGSLSQSEMEEVTPTGEEVTPQAKAEAAQTEPVEEA